MSQSVPPRGLPQDLSPVIDSKHELSPSLAKALKKVQVQLNKENEVSLVLQAKQNERAHWIGIQAALTSVAEFAFEEGNDHWLAYLEPEVGDVLVPERPKDWTGLNRAFVHQWLKRWKAAAKLIIEAGKIEWLTSSRPSDVYSRPAHEIFIEFVLDQSKGETDFERTAASLCEVRLQWGPKRTRLGRYFFFLAKSIKPGPNPFSEYNAKIQKRTRPAHEKLSRSPALMLAKATFEYAVRAKPDIAERLEIHGQVRKSMKALHDFLKENEVSDSQFGEKLKDFPTWYNQVNKVRKLEREEGLAPRSADESNSIVPIAKADYPDPN